MTQERNDFDPQAYHPRFQWIFLAPQYWGVWIAVLLGCFICFLPHSLKHLFAKSIASLALKIRSGAPHRARVNFTLCFPDLTENQRKTMLYNMYVAASMHTLNFPALTVRSKKWLEKKTVFHGFEHLEAIIQSEHNIILLAPHTWAIDIPSVLLASRGLPLTAMVKKQKNPLTDWLMHKQRIQYGGRIYERSGGIKPYLKSIRHGYLASYSPDQDHGADQSLFADFFNVPKATLPGLGRLAKLAKAKVIPMYAMFNVKTGHYELIFHPPLSLSNDDEQEDAILMNQCIEKMVRQHPEQYMWILALFKTRPDKSVSPYKQLK